jgi:hypothetical protein
MWAKLLIGYDVAERFDIGDGLKTLYTLLHNQALGTFDGSTLALNGVQLTLVSADDGHCDKDGVRMIIGLLLEDPSSPAEDAVCHSIPFDTFESHYTIVDQCFRNIGFNSSPTIFTLTTIDFETNAFEFSSPDTRTLILLKLGENHPNYKEISQEFSAMNSAPAEKPGKTSFLSRIFRK